MRSISFPGRRVLITVIAVFFLILFHLYYAAICALAVFFLSLYLYPIKTIRDFCLGVLPAIDALSSYMQSIIDVVTQEQTSPEYLLEEQKNVIKLLVSSSSPYPEWVYHIGFNPGLRSSLRYFLIQLERVSDTCFSMSYWLIRQNAIIKDGELPPLIANAMTNNIGLLNNISRYLYHQTDQTLQPLIDTNVNYVNDITALEDVLRRETPGSLELLDMSEGYVYLTALVRDIKDLRGILLQLVTSLPTKN